jgi:hypothetical protein
MVDDSELSNQTFAGISLFMQVTLWSAVILCSLCIDCRYNLCRL